MNACRISDETLLPGIASGGVITRQQDCVVMPPAITAMEGAPDWQAFADSWGDLPPDGYMGDGGTYRQRRYAAFRVSALEWQRLPHRPHYQDRAHNRLNGGIRRWFAPMQQASVSTAAFTRAMDCMRTAVGEREAAPPQGWFVEAHQFRIFARNGQPGLPTPEGMHHDGRDWVMILYVGGGNFVGGETTVDALHETVLRHRLSQPGEALFLDDRRLRHGTSAIEPALPHLPAWRDTLVMTFAHTG